MALQLKNFINGVFVPNDSAASIDVVSPSTGDIIATQPASSASDVDLAVTAAKSAFVSWSSLTIKQRAAIMFKFHHLVDSNSDELASLIKFENGKNITEALADVAKVFPTFPLPHSLT